MSNTKMTSGEARAAVPAAVSEPTRTDPNATVVVPVSVWEDQQRTIRELSAIVDEIKRDARDRETIAQLAQLRREFAQLPRPGDREGDELDAEYASLFPPAEQGDSLDPEYAPLFPPRGAA